MKSTSSQFLAPVSLWVFSACLAPLAIVQAQQPPPASPAPLSLPPDPAQASEAPKPAEKPGEAQEPPMDLDSQFGSSGGDTSDPFSGSSNSNQTKNISPLRSKEKRQGFRVRMETWEIGAVELAMRMDEHGPAWIEKMRQDCLKGATQNRLVFSPSTAADERTPQELESIAEEIYPTEWEPPSLPPGDLKTPPNASDLQKWAMAKNQIATPTSFETRNTGQSFSVVVLPVAPEAQKPGQPPAWDLHLSFSEVLLDKNQPWGLKDLQISEPRFTNFRIGTLVRLQPGRWTLVSAMEPPRTDDKTLTSVRWVTVVKIDPAE